MVKLNICQNISNTNIVIHVLACFIGIASWVDMSGLWLQLPIFVTVLPEKWTLSSYVVLIQQAANIGPIIFAICACVFARKKVEQPTSCLIIVIGIVACVLLSFFWDKTSFIGGTEHATALFGLSFMLAFVDTTSSLAFLSFMAMLKPEYLPSYFVGEGLSSLLPALVAFGQGSGNMNCVNISSHVSEFENGTWNNYTMHYAVPVFDPPVFSVQYFFLILAGFLILSLISFILLMCFPMCNVFETAYSSHSRSYSLEKTGADNPGLEIHEIAYTKTDIDIKVQQTKVPEEANNTYTRSYSHERNGIDNRGLEIKEKTEPISMRSIAIKDTQQIQSHVPKQKADDSKPVSTRLLLFLLAQTCWKGILFTITISIQPYFSLPYGLKVYHLSNTLGTVGLPLGCLLCLFLPMYSTVGVTLLTGLYSGLSAYFFYMASQSPNPPLVDDEAGPPVLITLGVVLMLVWTYSQVAIAGILRAGGRRSMIWMGISIQTGSVIGGIAAYVMVNEFHLFKDAQPC
ncbi:solute carrier family 52, riboflavin transporter, member 3-like [Gigantopelta aegis]|uniref:solute carrier family 52, riboflavin transporter, member 3-like n=1 Tax=Gigantopelta aegis TaxID=1735272 RepID=UPI001B88C3BC|nr:solute carrier family 52, riboflavin transporter, member 3-like [Gigantopelta aegis]XP_041372039.1 solute carrier family 52, riboflavin transporter, member 3-like [Gigantopelta aegis]